MNLLVTTIMIKKKKRKKERKEGKERIPSYGRGFFSFFYRQFVIYR